MVAASMGAFVVDVIGSQELVVRNGQKDVCRLVASESVTRERFGGPQHGIEGWIELYPATAQIMCVVVLRQLNRRNRECYAEVRRPLPQ